MPTAADPTAAPLTFDLRTSRGASPSTRCSGTWWTSYSWSTARRMTAQPRHPRPAAAELLGLLKHLYKELVDLRRQIDKRL